MNLILFERNEIGGPLPLGDWRYEHIRKILKLEKGEQFRCGILQGSLGTGTIENWHPDHLEWSFEESEEKPASLPLLTLLMGTPRPPTSRRLVKDLCTLGVGEMIFAQSELGEKSYGDAHFWTKDEFRRALIEGAQQGMTTLLPLVQKPKALWAILKSLENSTATRRILLHPEKPDSGFTDSLGKHLDLLKAENPFTPPHVLLALGPERGWSDKELILFQERGFQFCSLGPRILRTETAAQVASGLILDRLFW